MGQAKSRGSREARIANAVEKVEVQKPKSIVCNNCQAVLTNIATVDTKSFKGIAAAFSAHCNACNKDTFAVRGQREAVADFFLEMENKAGFEVNIGTAKPGNVA